MHNYNILHDKGNISVIQSYEENVIITKTEHICKNC